MLEILQKAKSETALIQAHSTDNYALLVHALGWARLEWNGMGWVEIGLARKDGNSIGNAELASSGRNHVIMNSTVSGQPRSILWTLAIGRLAVATEVHSGHGWWLTHLGQSLAFG